MFKPLAPSPQRLLLTLAAASVVCCPHAPALSRRQQDAPAAVTAKASAGPSDAARRGLELLRGNDDRAALKHLREAVKRAPADADAWHYLAIAQTRMGKPKDAVKSFRRAVELRPDFAAARAGLSYVLFATNKHDEATAEAVRAEQGDLDADAHFLLARVRLLFGDPPGALKHLDASVKLAPDFAPAHLLRSQTLVRWRNPSGRPSGPPDKETALALQRAAAERMAEAAASLETYLRLNPRGPDADLWRGQLESLRHYAQLAREAEGRELFGGREVMKKAVITFKPEPEFTPEARERGASGVVRLRLTLAADGTVKHVLVLEGLPHGLTEKAVSAARKIKFVPAEFGGRPVSTPVVVEYTFHVY